MSAFLRYLAISMFLSGIRSERYTRFHSGRHVCTMQKAIVEPVKTVESFSRPKMQSYSHPCQKGRICGGLRVVYGTGYRNVLQHRIRRQTDYICCPGWIQDTKLSYGCNRDINECAAENKPCDQICINTIGSFKCDCFSGYTLQEDSRTCRWNEKPSRSSGDDNVADVEVFAKKIARLEKMLRSHKYELSTEVSDDPTNSELLAMIETLQQKVETLMRYHDERWKKVESYTAKMQYLCNKVETLENKINFHNSCI